MLQSPRGLESSDPAKEEAQGVPCDPCPPPEELETCKKDCTGGGPCESTPKLKLERVGDGSKNSGEIHYLPCSRCLACICSRRKYSVVGG